MLQHQIKTGDEGSNRNEEAVGGATSVQERAAAARARLATLDARREAASEADRDRAAQARAALIAAERDARHPRSVAAARRVAQERESSRGGFCAC